MIEWVVVIRSIQNQQLVTVAVHLTLRNTLLPPLQIG